MSAQEQIRVELRPCSTCPFVVSTPAGVWDAHEYEKLSDYDDPTCLSSFLCHHSALGSAQTICRGWLAMYPDSLGARLLVSFGQLNDDDRWLPLPDDVALFESGTAARDAGLAAVERPPIEARNAIARLQRKRARVSLTEGPDREGANTDD